MEYKKTKNKIPRSSSDKAGAWFHLRLRLPGRGIRAPFREKADLQVTSAERQFCFLLWEVSQHFVASRAADSSAF